MDILSLEVWTYEECEKIMISAIKGGHILIVKYCFDKGFTDYNLGLELSIIYDRRKLVDLFLSKGANDWARAIKASRLIKNSKLRLESEKYFQKFLN